MANSRSPERPPLLAPLLEEAASFAKVVRGHMPVLDGLRGIAIAVVVAHNTGLAQTFAPTSLHKLLYVLHMHGWIGVHLFFVLSGFLITGILLDAKERDPRERRGIADYFRSFYVRRTLRIFPLYYAALIVAFAILPFVISSLVPQTPASIQVWYWTYLMNWVEPYGVVVPYFSHFWSLAVEEQFYLVWPLVVLACSRRALRWTCGALAIVALCVRAWLVVHDAPELAPYQLTTARMDALVLGGAAALAARTPAFMEKMGSHITPAFAVSALALVILFPFTHGMRIDAPLVQIAGHSLLALFFTCFLVVAVRAEIRRTRLARALSHPALRWLGRYSYGLYVFHLPIAMALRPTFGPLVVDPRFVVAAASLVGYIALVFAGSSIVALVSWNLFEKRLLALKDVLAPRIGSAA